MKKMFLVFVTVAYAMSVHSQKVALHSGGTVSIFNGTGALVSAYNQAVSGDTIYLPGGSFSVPAAVNKKLVIYGAGHYPDSSMATGKTIWNGNLSFGLDADQFVLEGLEVTGNITFPYDGVVDNVRISRCNIIGSFTMNGGFTTPSNNLILFNNVLGRNLDLSNAQNVLVANNIIGQGIYVSKGNSFLNNVFLDRSPYGYYEHFTGCDNNLIYNNVFYQHAPYGENGNNNDFRNNLFTHATPGLGTNPTSVNNYFGVAQSAVFVNSSSTSFSYQANYHLKNPSTYTGTDGTEIGIYGGTLYPWKEGALPSNPHIRSHSIAPATSNGLLNVQIEAAAQDN
jgi:hypothetical protein